jgi:hypothetical protein
MAERILVVCAKGLKKDGEINDVSASMARHAARLVRERSFTTVIFLGGRSRKKNGKKLLSEAEQMRICFITILRTEIVLSPRELVPWKGKVIVDSFGLDNIGHIAHLILQYPGSMRFGDVSILSTWEHLPRLSFLATRILPQPVSMITVPYPSQKRSRRVLAALYELPALFYTWRMLRGIAANPLDRDLVARRILRCHPRYRHDFI